MVEGGNSKPSKTQQGLLARGHGRTESGGVRDGDTRTMKMDVEKLFLGEKIAHVLEPVSRRGG